MAGKKQSRSKDINDDENINEAGGDEEEIILTDPNTGESVILI